MSKDPIPLSIPDISKFARILAQQLKDAETPPSHLSLMNMLARSAGFQNYQHMRAANTSQVRLDVAPTSDAVDFRLVERTLNQFDDQGRLMRWPSRRAVQNLCLWALWARIPSDVHMHEKQVNAHLNAAHLFQDAAILRRSLFGMKLLSRNLDGSDYQRLEKRPPADAQEVIRRLKDRISVVTA